MYVLIDTVVFNYFNFDFNLLKVTCGVQRFSAGPQTVYTGHAWIVSKLLQLYLL